ncbi:MAG: outer membrane beta-barrel protein [Saprospiraceae bacterium]|nr:outer membrane beta-barrel protein [Saprospiraceae bacterium]
MREQDKKLKEKFQQYSIVPPETVWYKIEQRLSSKQRGLFFFQEIQKINFIASMVGLLLVMWLSFDQISSDMPTQSFNSESADNAKQDNTITDKVSVSQIANSSGDKLLKKPIRKAERIFFEKDQNINTNLSDRNGENTITNGELIEKGIVALDHFPLSDLMKQEESWVNTKERGNVYVSPEISILGLQKVSNQDAQLNFPAIVNKKITKPQNQYYLEVFTGAEYISRKLEAKSSEYNDFAVNRNETEKFVSSIQGGVLIGVNFPSKWSIAAGLNYSNETYLFNAKLNSSRWKTALVAVDTLFSNPQNPEIVYKSIQYTETGVLNTKVYNSLHSIQMPIKIGYSFSIPKMRINLFVGLNTGYLFYTRGQVADLKGSSQNIQYAHENNPYKLGINMNATTGISFAYLLNSSLAITMEPQIQIPIIGYSESTYPLLEKQTRYGLRLGLRYGLR